MSRDFPSRAIGSVGFGLSLAATISVLLLGGCGAQNPRGRQPISGVVRFNGQPIKNGSIEFNPQNQQAGLRTGAMIVAGRYEIPELKGLPPGQYLVRIFSASSMSSANLEPSRDSMTRSSALPPELIPSKYNQESTLTVKIGAGGAQKFDFDLAP